MCLMRIIHVCSCRNYGAIPVSFSQMVVSKNSGVDAPFQQKFKCHSSKMSRGHCNYPNAVSCVSIRSGSIVWLCLFGFAHLGLLVRARLLESARFVWVYLFHFKHQFH